MCLYIRRKIFKTLKNNCNGKVNEINDLMLEIKIPKKKIKNLKSNIIDFIAKSFNDNQKIKNETDLIKKIKNKNDLIKNMTPNGLLMPKKENAEAFNKILKSYASIIKFLGIQSLVHKFHFPPNIRLKLNKIKKDSLNRPFSTEMMHADPWSGANPNWCALHMFIFGDIKNNNIRYAYPPNSFKENWLKPVKNTRTNKKIISQYNIIDYVPKKNSIILADAAIIHQSYNKNNKGIRISLDTGFDLVNKHIKRIKKTTKIQINTKKTRNKEMITARKLFDIGKKIFFTFKESINSDIVHKSKFEHPVSSKFIAYKK